MSERYSPTGENPLRMSAAQIREYARNGGLPTMHFLIKSLLSKTPECPQSRWQHPLLQIGDTGQTYVHVNGIRSWTTTLKGKAWFPTPRSIDECRRVSGKYEGRTHAMTVAGVARGLQKIGMLAACEPTLNPVRAAANMAARGYAAITDGRSGRHMTIVPNLARLRYGHPRPAEFIAMEPTAGSHNPVSAEDFCDLALKLEPSRGDSMLICIVNADTIGNLKNLHNQ